MNLVLIFVTVILVTSCSTATQYLKGTDNTMQPADLQDFEEVLQLITIWKRTVGKGPKSLHIKLVPALSGEHIFVATRHGKVSSFNAKTGEKTWESNMERLISGGPGVGSGLVMVGTRDGHVVALSAVEGTLVWSTRMSSEILSAPQAADGVVVVRSTDGRLTGLSAITGQQLWVYEREVPSLTLRGTSNPVISSGIAVAGFDGGRVVGISLQAGLPLWETRVAIPTGRSELERLVDIDGTLQVVDDTIYVTTFQGRTAALDLKSGATLWQRDMSSYAGLGIDDRAIYITAEDSHVWAIDRGSSASIWRQNKLFARKLTAPVSIGEFIAVGDFEGYIHILNRENGAMVAREQIDSDGIFSAPIVGDQTLYVYSRAGKLSALKLSVR